MRAAIVKQTYVNVNEVNSQKGRPLIEMPTPAMLEKCTIALSGLPQFIAETVSAMSFGPEGMSIPELWERKRKQIEATRGLTMWRGSETFKEAEACAGTGPDCLALCPRSCRTCIFPAAEHFEGGSASRVERVHTSPA